MSDSTIAVSPVTDEAEGERTLECLDLVIKYDGSTAVDGVSFSIPKSKVTTLVGPNGSGKSTTLNCLARLLKPASGAVYLNGRDIAEQQTRDVAKKLALLPQNVSIPPSITVKELVAFGRYPHQGMLGQSTAEDKEAVEWALHATGLEPLEDRVVDSLSGGERQRAWVAMTLAQQTSILLLDEPTTFLDIHYQLELLSLIRQLNRRYQLTVCMVLHDLNQAAEFSDNLIMLQRGRVLAEGQPTEVMSPENILRVFRLKSLVMAHPVTGKPLCIPVTESVHTHLEDE